MALSRILRYLNCAIGVALVTLLFGIYWYAWRPLAQTSGTLEAPVTARAVVSRDSLGVPHIMAANQPDALFLQGYVTAQDRLFQMDALRRAAAGELAEVAGPGAVAADLEARRMRMRAIAEGYYAVLPPQDRAVLAAHARGVNFFIATHRGRLPLEFTLLGYEPRPWSVVDSLLVMLKMMNTMDRSWPADLRKERLLAGGNPYMVDYLYPGRSGGETRPGSNAWALSGARSATRAPLLAGDVHLEFSLPSPLYMVHVRGPRLNVTGLSIPGLPGVLVGHNGRIAWSVTSLAFDVQDLYVERFDQVSGRYLFRGKVEQARAVREVLRIKGRASENVALWITKHGPIFAAEGGRFLSLRWAAADAAGSRYPLLDIDKAQDWQEFRGALAAFPGPALTFVYADIAGNIGSQVAGRLPVRKNFDGGVPVDGASGAFEWEGFIPFDKLPATFNPAAGMVVSANQNPFAEDYPYTVSGDFPAPYRLEQIRARLESTPGWRAAGLLRVQTDVYSAFSHFLAREVVAAFDRHRSAHPDMAAPVDLLRRWDGQMRAEQAAPLLMTLAYQHLRTALGERASPGKGIMYRSRMAPAVIERLLRGRPPGWFEDYDRFLLANFQDAVAEGRRMQGRDAAKWEYGAYNFLRLPNRVVTNLPLAGKYFNIGPVPLSGSPETVNQIFRDDQVLGPSMRMVIDFANLEASFANITLGQSGQVLSKHYKDQWDAYRAGASFPMQFEKIAAKGTLVFVPERQ